MSENSRSEIQFATGMAMTVRKIMILLYGAGGVPGRGEIPMNTMKHIVTQAFPARQKPPAGVVENKYCGQDT
jgi:hypothetical protein